MRHEFRFGNNYRSFESKKRSLRIDLEERGFVFVFRRVKSTPRLSPKERFLNSFSSRDRRSTLTFEAEIHCFHCDDAELRTASGEIPRIYLLTPDVRGIICLATRFRLRLLI